MNQAYVDGFNSVIEKRGQYAQLMREIAPHAAGMAAGGAGIGALAGLHKDTPGRSAATGAATAGGIAAGGMAAYPLMGRDVSRGLLGSMQLGKAIRKGSMGSEAELARAMGNLQGLPSGLVRLGSSGGGKARIIAAALAPILGGVGAYKLSKQPSKR